MLINASLIFLFPISYFFFLFLFFLFFLPSLLYGPYSSGGVDSIVITKGNFFC